MILNSTEFRHELEKVNNWWLTGKVDEAERYPFKRYLFEEIKDELKTRRIIILLGPRRVGKSVLIKQLIGTLIKKGTASTSLMYYSLDDPTLFTYSDNLIKDLIDYYCENIARDGVRYIFLDEIQSFKEWFKWIKSYYDKFPDIKFILTGSSSLSLQKDANKYLKGRFVEADLYPLDFREFLGLSGVDVEKTEISRKDIGKIDELEVEKLWHRIRVYYDEYLLAGGFPEWFEMKSMHNAVTRWFSRLTNDIPKRAIYEDMVERYGVKNPKVLELIFTFIAANQSKILSYETINEVARLDRVTLVNYIEFLKVSYLVIEVLKFAKIKEQMKAKKKFLVIDQGLRNAILKDYQVKEDNIGFIIENLIGLKLFFQAKKENKNLCYWKVNGEIDFVVSSSTGKDILPVEVKYRNEIRERELKGFFNLVERNECERGIVITKNFYKRQKIRGKQILFVPAWLYLLY